MEILLAVAGLFVAGTILVGLCLLVGAVVKTALVVVAIPFKLLFLPILAALVLVKVALVVTFVTVFAAVFFAVIVPVAIVMLLFAAPFVVIAALS